MKLHQIETVLTLKLNMMFGKFSPHTAPHAGIPTRIKLPTSKSLVVKGYSFYHDIQYVYISCHSFGRSTFYLTLIELKNISLEY